MRKWLLHIFLVSVLGMLTASCSQNADDPTQDVPSKSADTEKVTIRFTIDLGEQSGMSSRAAWEGYDDDGTYDSSTAEEGIGNENYINTSNLQVFLFNTTGAYIGGLKDMEANSTSTAHIYEIKGEVDVVKSAIVNKKLNCKIMVVANADAATTNATSGKVTGYNYNAVFNHDVTTIPMWGIGTYSIDLIQQLQVDLNEPIYMLRSMAKIEVTLGGEYTDASGNKRNLYTDGYRITGATLSNYNTQGYVVPTYMILDTDENTQANPQTVELSALGSTTDLLTDGVFRSIDNKLANTAKSFSDVDNIQKTYVIYVPEMPKGTDNSPIKVNLRLGKVAGTNDNGSENITDITASVMKGNPHFELKDYSKANKGHYDIIRNWYYKYTINTISDGIEVMLAVAPWTENKDILDYTQHTANYHVSSIDGTLGWIDDTFTKKENNEITLNLNETATFKVNIGTPINAEWRVTLDDPQNMFEFNTNEGEGFSGTQQEDSKTIYGFNDVDGEVVTIGIKSKSPNTTGVYSAILRMYINLGTKWIQLDLVDGDITNGISVYTIKHVKSGL